jgi:YD repeat-containing protein
MKRSQLYKRASTNFCERPSGAGLRRCCQFAILLLVIVYGAAIPPYFHADQLIFGLDSAAAAEVSYVYDDLGRLKAVIDPGTDTAIYNYDAVGNLLSISRQPSTAISIIDFTPKTGPVGTTVTIFGTGFSSTAGQNTVTFNSLATTVTSASPTMLVATVPAGATTGPIGVSSPSGSATSSQVFTVENAGAQA